MRDKVTAARVAIITGVQNTLIELIFRVGVLNNALLDLFSICLCWLRVHSIIASYFFTRAFTDLWQNSLCVVQQSQVGGVTKTVLILALTSL